MSEHTPGPWEVDEATEAGGQNVRVVARHTDLSAVCRIGLPGADRVMEDARLIAAAPDLLAACKLCKELLDGGFTLNQAKFAVEDAINKAEGR